LKIYDLNSMDLLLEQKVFMYNKITKIKIFDFEYLKREEKIVILIGENKISYFFWNNDFISELNIFGGECYIKNKHIEKILIRELILDIRLEYHKINSTNKIENNKKFDNTEDRLNMIIKKVNLKLFNLLPEKITNNSENEKSIAFINQFCNNDMILDCLFIPVKNCLILGTVNNYILIYKTYFNKNESIKMNIKFISKVFCPEKCIVYAMSIKTFDNTKILESNIADNYTDILIASGTVFRKIVYWKVKFQCSNEDETEDNEKSFKENSCLHKILDLKGHEGVVFNLEIIEKNKIISVSDDRTCKIWYLSSKFEDDELEDYSYESLIDHNARVWNFIYDKYLKLLVTVSEDNTIKIYKESFNLEIKNKNFKLIKNLEGHIGKNIRSIHLAINNIFTSAEDGQLIKWNIKNFIEVDDIDKNENLIDKNSKEDKINEIKPNLKLNQVSYLNLSFSLSNEDSQFLLARKTQKNFSSCVKCLRIIDLEILRKQQNLIDISTNKNSLNFIENEEGYSVLIGSNHGDLIYTRISKENNVLESRKIFSDENCRVINSILYIYETKTILVGLSDGVLLLIKFNPLSDFYLNKFEAKSVNIFASKKIRITFLYYQIFESKKNPNEKNVIFVFSNPVSENKIFYMENICDKQNNEKFVENFVSKFEKNSDNILKINSFVKDKMPTTSVAIKKLKNNHFIIFFGDFNGIIYHTILLKIDQQLYNYNELKYFIAHDKEKVSKILVMKDNHKISNYRPISKSIISWIILSSKKLIYISYLCFKLHKIYIFKYFRKFDS